jgi:hypothetical protein
MVHAGQVILLSSPQVAQGFGAFGFMSAAVPFDARGTRAGIMALRPNRESHDAGTEERRKTKNKTIAVGDSQLIPMAMLVSVTAIAASKLKFSISIVVPVLLLAETLRVTAGGSVRKVHEKSEDSRSLEKGVWFLRKSLAPTRACEKAEEEGRMRHKGSAGM